MNFIWITEYVNIDMRPYPTAMMNKNLKAEASSDDPNPKAMSGGEEFRERK